VQAVFQLAVCFGLLFGGHKLFNVNEGEVCLQFKSDKSSSKRWDTATHKYSDTGTITCDSFKAYYPALDYKGFHAATLDPTAPYNSFRFADLHEYEDLCLTCTAHDYTHGTIIFNAFIFCQLWNEYTSRKLFDEWNMFEGVLNNRMFIIVSLVSTALQVFLVQVGGEWVKTSPLNLEQWLGTIAIGAIGIPIGMLQRFIPVKEDEGTFFTHTGITSGASVRKGNDAV
jgi:magnesium-transporting ATPase (P-type)